MPPERTASSRSTCAWRTRIRPTSPATRPRASSTCSSGPTSSGPPRATRTTNERRSPQPPPTRRRTARATTQQLTARRLLVFVVPHGPVMASPSHQHHSHRTRPRDQSVAGSLGFAVAAIALMQTISIPLLPVLAEAFDTSIAAVSWVATSTLIVGAAATRSSGGWGTCTASGGSCSVASRSRSGVRHRGDRPSLPVVVAGRAVQGLGSGVIPLSYGIIRDRLPDRHVGRGIAVIAGEARASAPASAPSWSAPSSATTFNVRGPPMNRGPGAGPDGVAFADRRGFVITGRPRRARGWVMGGEALAGSSAGERLALSGETFEQRCRRPLRTGARLQLPQTADDLVEPDAIGVVHRAAAVGGPVVTVDPDDVDV